MKYCEEYAALLDLFVDGELPPEEMAQVQAHLAECPGCQAYVDDALALRAGFPDVETTIVPEGFAEGVMKRVREESGGRPKTVAMRRKYIRRWAGIGALAACCALAVLMRTGFGGGYGAAMVTGSGGASGEYAMDTGNLAGSAGGGDVSPQMAEPAEIPETADAEGMAPETAMLDKEADQSESKTEARMAAAEAGGTDGGAAPVPPASAPSTQAALEDAPARLHLTAHEAGGLLDDFKPAWENAMERGYELNEEEYRELLKALDRQEELPETAEGPFLVVVTGPFA